MASGSGMSFDNDFGDRPYENIKVIAVCREMTVEESSKYDDVVKVFPKKGCIKLQCKKFAAKLFNFDAAYCMSASPIDMFKEVFQPLVWSFINGYNVTIFNYGQSGAGKTFFMEGYPGYWEGLISAVIKDTFHIIERVGNDATLFTITASYFEIDNEQIFDLLLKPKKLVVEEGNDTGVPNVSKVVCKTHEEMEKLLHDGKQNRIGNPVSETCTKLGSHAIFIINVESKESDGRGYELVRNGQIMLVDLAGKPPKTNAASMKDKDCKSLEVFSKVISALAEKKADIPYADSRLTELLKESLGGSSKCLMIANISPASCNYHETVITLRDAKKIQSIRNRPLGIIVKCSLDKARIIAQLPFHNLSADKANDEYFEELIRLMDEVFIEESVAKAVMKSLKRHINKREGRPIEEDFEEPDEAIELLTANLDTAALSDPRKAADFFNKCIDLLPTFKKK